MRLQKTVIALVWRLCGTLWLNTAWPILEPQEWRPCGHSPTEGSAVAASTTAQASTAAPTLPLHSTNSDLALPSQTDLGWTRCSLYRRHHGSQGGTRPSAQLLTELLGCSKYDRTSNSRSSWLCPTLPSQDLPGYQGDIVTRKLCLTVARQCHTLFRG